MIVERAVTRRRIAIGSERKVGVGARERLGVQNPHTLAGVALAACAAARLRHVNGQRADGRVGTDTHVHGLEVPGNLQAGRHRAVIGQAVDQRTTDETRGWALVTVVLARGKVVLQTPLAQHQRQAGERVVCDAPGAVRFNDGDFQVAVGAGRENISQLERPGRHVGAIEHIAALAHLDYRVGRRLPTHHRCVAALAVGQHRVIGANLHPRNRTLSNSVASEYCSPSVN